MKGSTCKHCLEKYHNCGSCEYDSYSDKGYCSQECLMSSKEFKSAKRNSQAFYDSLIGKQKEQFLKFIEDNDNFEYMDLFSAEPLTPPLRVRHEGLIGCWNFYEEGDKHVCRGTKIAKLLEKYLGWK